MVGSKNKVPDSTQRCTAKDRWQWTQLGQRKILIGLKKKFFKVEVDKDRSFPERETV